MEINITIPENWQEVTLEQYMKFYKAVKPYEQTEDYHQKLLERAMYYFCNIDADVYRKLPKETFDEVSNDMLNLIANSNEQKLVLSFELFDQKYGFIPSLDEMSYGEYVDLVTYSKDTWQNIALIMSILYRPIIEEKNGKYKIQSYSGTVDNQVELFNKKLTMDVVFGSIAFFLSLRQDLVNDTLTSSIKTLKKMTEDPTSQVAQTLAKNGISMQQLQSWQEMTSQNLMK